jgi:hypothetical protein
MSAEDEPVSGVQGVDGLLRWTWWALFPMFAALTIRLAGERTCGDPYDLLPGVTGDPSWAWPLAVVYVLAHAWSIAVYLTTVSRTQTLLPPARAWRTTWGRDQVKLMLMALALVIEYAPMAAWRTLGIVIGCRH